MNRKVLLGTVVVVAGAGVLLWQLTRDDANAGKRDGTAAAPQPKPVRSTDTARADSNTAPPPVSMQPLSIDDDPIGPLRLEGIVLDDRDTPVAGAQVFLNSNPPRTATSGEDGTFAFDKLVGRMYSLTARADDAAGGPVIHRLTETSDPVAVRVRLGAQLEVTVVAKDTGAPLEGATVGVYGQGGPTDTTDDDGRATLRGVRRGGHIVYAEAPGYGRERQVVQVPESSEVLLHQRLELERGAPVSGRVVDPNGKPVAGARVMATNAGAFAPMNPEHDAVETDDEGKFTLPAVGKGTFRFVALHSEHPPSSTELLHIDGTSERSDIVIVMELGGILAGRVVDETGAPTPWATVRIGRDPESKSGATNADTRQAVAAEDGTFRLEGVARKPLAAFATSETASSELVRFDLGAEGDKLDLVLTLSLGGTIAGTVVDEAGEPLAELQVTAIPDFANGEPIEELSIRGPAFAVTDGGGGFVIRGLRDGQYRLWAARDVGGQTPFMRKATTARVGDDDVKIVLPADGGIEGTARFSDGKPPALMTVAVAGAAGVPARDGVFRIDGLPAGSYDVTFRGPDFTEKTLRDVEVEPGALVDIGNVELERGRAVKGRVVDARGRAVANATVAYGRQLIGNGESMTLEIGQQLDERLGVRRTTTDQRGEFRISGIGKDDGVVAAEQADQGRSHPVDVPGGEDDAVVELALAPLGAVEGIVRHNGEPAAQAALILGSTASGRQSTRAQTGPDGTFALGKVPAGTYKLTAMLGTGLGANMTSKPVEVGPGETARVELDLRTGNIEVKVVVKGVDDAPIDAAQVFLFEGEMKLSSADQLMKAFNDPKNQGGAKMSIAFMPRPASFSKTVAGAYSACVIPINGDLADPKFNARLQRHVTSLRVYCQPLAVAESPDHQEFTAVVPPMAPLPE